MVYGQIGGNCPEAGWAGCTLGRRDADERGVRGFLGPGWRSLLTASTTNYANLREVKRGDSTIWVAALHLSVQSTALHLPADSGYSIIK
jgi:hypothetical protein